MLNYKDEIALSFLIELIITSTHLLFKYLLLEHILLFFVKPLSYIDCKPTKVW